MKSNNDNIFIVLLLSTKSYQFSISEKISHKVPCKHYFIVTAVLFIRFCQYHHISEIFTRCLE